MDNLIGAAKLCLSNSSILKTGIDTIDDKYLSDIDDIDEYLKNNEIKLEEPDEYCMLFKRKMYYKCIDFINSDKIYAMIIGPRKIGKTYCLKQLELTYPNTKYYNFKKDKDIFDILDNIVNCQDDTIFLLDEITNVECYNEFMEELYESVLTKNYKAKIIFTGSSISALEFIWDRVFITKCETITTSFIDFEEWLVYRNKINYKDLYYPSEEDYYDYISNTGEFLGINNNMDYLKGCLTETIISERNAIGHVDYYINKRDVNIFLVTALLYSTLFSLCREVSIDNVYDYSELFNKNLMGMSKSDKSLFKEAFKNVFNKYFIRIRKCGLEELQKSIYYLYQNGLITISTENDNIDEYKVLEWFKHRYGIDDINKALFKKKGDVFDNNIKLNIINPIFYSSILKEVVDEANIIAGYNKYDLSILLNRTFIGYIYEANIRSTLSAFQRNDIYKPTKVTYQYRLNGNEEIDLVDDESKYTVEFSIGYKDTGDLVSLKTDKYKKYKCIVTSKNYFDITSSIIRIPYTLFLLKAIRYLTIDTILFKCYHYLKDTCNITSEVVDSNIVYRLYKDNIEVSNITLLNNIIIDYRVNELYVKTGYDKFLFNYLFEELDYDGLYVNMEYCNESDRSRELYNSLGFIKYNEEYMVKLSNKQLNKGDCNNAE